MDQHCLDAVLSEPEFEGATWAAFRGAELVAVIETGFDPQDVSMASVKAITTSRRCAATASV